MGTTGSYCTQCVFAGGKWKVKNAPHSHPNLDKSCDLTTQLAAIKAANPADKKTSDPDGME